MCLLSDSQALRNMWKVFSEQFFNCLRRYVGKHVRQNMKKLKILKLSPDFRYLQKLALKLISAGQNDQTGRSEWSHDLFKNSDANDRFSQGRQQFSDFGTVTTCSSIQFRGRILRKFKAKNGACHNVQSLVMGATVETLTHFSVTFLTKEK